MHSLFGLKGAILIMQHSLLDKARRINRIVQSKNQEYLDFAKLSATIGDVIDANVYLINKDGRIVTKYLTPFVNMDINISEDGYLYKKIYNFLWSFIDTRPNIALRDILNLTDLSNINADHAFDIKCCVTPIIASEKRLGTMFFIKSKGEFTEEDILLVEYVSTLVALEFLNIINEENQEEIKKKLMIKSAIETLSSSELEAVINIFDELKSNEGLLIASKVADRIGITRSVIVNALRKFESAGLIETRSLGLKGTYIKVLNDMLRAELDQYRKDKASK